MSNQVEQIIKRFRNGSISTGNPKNPKRHGWKKYCKTCKARENIGGVRNGIEYFSALRELEKYKKLHFEHDYKIEHSYHSAELAHVFKELTTNASLSSGNSYVDTDTTNCRIASSNFVTGRKYLLLIMAHVGATNNTNRFGWRIEEHGGIGGFPNSQLQLEVNDTADSSRYQYVWFIVYTAPSTVRDIDFQMSRLDSFNSCNADQIVMLSIELSEDLTEGDDWDYSEDNTGNTGLTSTFTTTNNASLTKTFNGTDTVLFFAGDRIKAENNGKEARSQIFKAGSGINEEWNQEGEDVGKDEQCHFHTYTEVPANSSITWTSRSAYESGGGATGDRLDSRLFWLRLNALRNFEESFASSSQGVSLDTFVNQRTITIDPDVTGDVFCLSYAKLEDAVQDQQMVYRQQVANVDQPPTQTSDDYNFGERWDSQDQIGFSIFSVENFGDSRTVDLDAHTSVSGGFQSRDRFVVAFTFELPSSGLSLVEVAATATVGLTGASNLGLRKTAPLGTVGLTFATNLGLRKTLSDIVDLTEGAFEFRKIFNIPETIGLTESPNLGFVKNATTFIVGLVSSINLGLRKTAPLDTVDINEASEKVLGLLKNITTDIVGLVSTVNLGLRKTVSDIVDLISSGENRLLGLVRTKDDIVDINEEPNRLMVIGAKFGNDIVGLISAVNLGLRKTLSDIVDISEDSNILRGVLKNVAVSTVGLISAVNLGLRKTAPLATVGIDEARNRLGGLIRNIAVSTVGLISTVNLGLRKTVSDIVDLIEASEKIITLGALIEVVNDIIDLTSSVNLALRKTVSDIIDINESSNRLGGLIRNISTTVIGLISSINLGLRKTAPLDTVDINEVSEKILGILKNAAISTIGLISAINLGLRKTSPLDTIGITESGENRLLELVRNATTNIVGLVSTVNLGLRKTLNDIVDLNEASESIKQIILNVVTDIVEIIEGTPIRLLGLIQIATTSTVGLISAVNLGLRKTISSVVELTETKNLGLRKTLNDIVDINELSNRLMVISAKIINTIVDINVPAELVNLAHRKNVNDTVDLNEDSNRLGGLIRVITTSIVGILESVNLGIRKTVALSTININEASNRLKVIGAKVIDTIVEINESSNKLLTASLIIKNIGEILGLTSLINLGLRKTKSDIVDINESPNRLGGLVRVTTTFIVGLTSSVNLGIRKTVSDIIQLSETPNKLIIILKNVATDTVGIISSINLGIRKTISDSVNITEVRNRLRDIIKNIPDIVGINEIPVRLTGLLRNISVDIIGIIESSESLIALATKIKNSVIGLTEFVNFLLKRPNREVTGISLINISVEGISIINTSIEGISLVNASAVGISL